MKNTTILFTVFVIFFWGCRQPTNNNNNDCPTTKTTTITGAGATFPMQFYNLAFKAYTKKTGNLVTYAAIGSGGGIRSLKDKVVDFGATDAFITNEKIDEFDAPIIHIPTCVGAVVIAYNLPGVDNLKLSSSLISAVFMDEITKWSDPRIAEVNPDAVLPDVDITVVHRSDGSGTTYIFSHYMSQISQKWKSTTGCGKILEWPAGISAKGNQGVAGTIQQTEGAIGYVSSEYAFSQQLQMAKIENSSGNYIRPETVSIGLAAKGNIPEDTRTMLTNADYEDAYPISGFTWIIIYKEQAYNERTIQQAEATIRFMEWLISNDAQKLTTSVHYSPLPQKVVEYTKNKLKSITYSGKPVFEKDD